MRVGVSLRTAFLVDDVRLGAGWIVERAAGGPRTPASTACSSATTTSYPVPYYQNTPLLGRLLAEWGDAALRGAVPAAAVEPRCSSPSRSARWPRSAPGRFILPLAVGGGTSSSRPWASQLRRPRQQLRGRPRHRPPAARRRDRDHRRPLSRAGRPRLARPARAGRGVDRRHRRTRRRPGRTARRRVPRRRPPDPAKARATIELYRERCEAHGRTPTAIAIRRDIHVGRRRRRRRSRGRPGRRGRLPGVRPVGVHVRRRRAGRRAARASTRRWDTPT